MFKLMIVEDEEIIREGLCNTIDWSGIGYEVVGEAEDVDSAMKVYHDKNPDVILTDIRLIESNGLTLLENVKKISPDVEVILLSSYSEFSYATEGLKNGAFAYILKIDMFHELETVFEQLKEKLEKKIKKRIEYNGLLEMKNKYDFARVIEGKKYTCLFGENEGFSFFMAIYVPSMTKIVNDLLDDCFDSKNYVKFSKDNYIFIGIHMQMKFSAFEIYKEEQIKEVKIVLDRKNITKYHIGISDITDDLNKIKLCCLKASKMLDIARIEKKANLYDYEKCFNNMENCSCVNRNELNKQISLNNEHEIAFLIKKEFKHNLYNSIKTIENLKTFCSEILFRLNAVLKEMDGVLYTPVNLLIDEMNKYISIIELEKWILINLKDICNYINTLKREKYLGEISKGVEYVDKCYLMDIKLEEVARFLYMSSSLFSTRFKEAVGVSFVDYIKKKRVSKACELLINEEMKIYEVAAKVGYKDEKYFTKIFKKIMNIPPKEYRNQYSRIKKEVL